MATKPWGVFEHPYPGDNLASVTNLATLVGASPSYVLFYKQFSGSNSSFVSADYTVVHTNGMTPIMNFNPIDVQNGTIIHNTDVTSGAWDTVINNFAQGIATLPFPVYLRFAHEMNGTWYPFAPGQNGNTPATYIAMWQYVWGKFQAAGATNVKWVFCANTELVSQLYTYVQLYPGDAYVDFIAIDGYNKSTYAGGTWQSYSQIFSQSITDLVAVAPTKPLFIGEIGCVEGNAPNGTSKAAWIEDALHQIWTDSRVTFFTWFDYYDTLPNLDYRITTSTNSQLAFTSALVTTTSFGAVNLA